VKDLIKRLGKLPSRFYVIEKLKGVNVHMKKIFFVFLILILLVFAAGGIRWPGGDSGGLLLGLKFLSITNYGGGVVEAQESGVGGSGGGGDILPFFQKSEEFSGPDELNVLWSKYFGDQNGGALTQPVIVGFDKTPYVLKWVSTPGLTTIYSLNKKNGDILDEIKIPGRTGALMSINPDKNELSVVMKNGVIVGYDIRDKKDIKFDWFLGIDSDDIFHAFDWHYHEVKYEKLSNGSIVQKVFAKHSENRSRRIEVKIRDYDMETITSSDFEGEYNPESVEGTFREDGGVSEEEFDVYMDFESKLFYDHLGDFKKYVGDNPPVALYDGIVDKENRLYLTAFSEYTQEVYVICADYDQEVDQFSVQKINWIFPIERKGYNLYSDAYCSLLTLDKDRLYVTFSDAVYAIGTDKLINW